MEYLVYALAYTLEQELRFSSRFFLTWLVLFTECGGGEGNSVNVFARAANGWKFVLVLWLI